MPKQSTQVSNNKLAKEKQKEKETKHFSKLVQPGIMEKPCSSFPCFSISVFLSLFTTTVLAADPDMLQDVCVADLNSSKSICYTFCPVRSWIKFDSGLLPSCAGFCWSCYA